MKKFAKPIFAMKIHQRFNQELCTITYVHLSYFQTNTLLESNYKEWNVRFTFQFFKTILFDN